jgi:Leucine-rich repeat (LRR) protein
MKIDRVGRLKRIFLFSCGMLVLLSAGYFLVMARAERMRFPDEGLEQAIRKESGRTNGPLYGEDLEGIRRLNAANFSITNLAGIEYLPNLESLDLRGNPVSSVEELLSLQKLVELSLRNTEIDDIAPLSDLVRLRRLDLRGTDLGKDGLEPLKNLRALEELNLRESGITELDALGSLQNLRYLNIHSNSGITSLKPIAGLGRLQTLIMRHVPSGGNLRELSNLQNLRRLNVRNTGLRDLSVLAELMSKGALQDTPQADRKADVDIRDNPVLSHPTEGPVGYDVLLPFWSNISRREPPELPRNPSREVIINEVLSSNGSTVNDSSGDYHDWIELHNPGDESVDISGYYLSDTQKEPRRWSFPEGAIIGPEEFLLVWAPGRNAEDPDGEMHTNFALSADGTELVLTSPRGSRIVDMIDVPALPRDTSYGLQNTGEFVRFVDPTPGRSNSGAKEYLSVDFSRPGGLYKRPFVLDLSIPDDSVDIFYTLDGSLPDPDANPDSTKLYHGPVDIDPQTLRHTELSRIPTTIPDAEMWEWQPPADEGPQAVVVRAVAFDDTKMGDVRSETFFVGPDFNRDFPLAVMSIIADPEDFFSEKNGIYVPGQVFEENRGYDGPWMQHPANYTGKREVPAHLEFYEPDGYKALDLDGGVRIHGGWSRSHPLKSLRLYARKDYDVQNYFSYQLFPDALQRDRKNTITEYKRLILRSSQSLFRSHMQDSLSQDHVRDYVATDLLRSRPLIHFVNGEYWGLTYLRERFDRFYLESNYGINPDDAVILEGPLGLESQIKYGSTREQKKFRELWRYVADNDMRDDHKYHRVKRHMDVDSFIDYNILRIFSGDADGVTNHVAMWRIREGSTDSGPAGVDGRWRWHTWDLDNALLFLHHDTMSFYANDGRTEDLHGSNSGSDNSTQVEPHDPRYTALLAGLLRNNGFRHRFINRFADLLNTVYRPRIHSDAIEDAASLIEPEIRRHIRRWGYPESYEYWREQVDSHLEFARLRPSIQRQHIHDYFNARYDEPNGTASVTVAAVGGGGSVRINTLFLDGELPGTDELLWSGRYFTGIPIELEALPEDGYRFAGWRGDVPDDLRDRKKISFPLNSDIDMIAEFRGL